MEQYGNCPRQLHFCPVCPRCPIKGCSEGVFIEHPSLVGHTDWCSSLKCNICHTSWFICRQCQYRRTHMLDINSFRKYYLDKHLKRKIILTKRKHDNIKKINTSEDEQV